MSGIRGGLIIIYGVIALGCVMSTNSASVNNLNQPKDKDGAFNLWSEIELEIDDNKIHFNIFNEEKTVFTGFLGSNTNKEGTKKCRESGSNTESRVCFEGEDGHRLEIYDNGIGRQKRAADIQCTTVNRTVNPTSHAFETQEDCFSMKDFYWFGGFEEASQVWPINTFKMASVPFVTSEGFSHNDYGGVIEGIFLSSSGTGIVIDETTPLYLSINDKGSQMICLKGKTGNDTPYFHYSQPFLLYHVCKTTDLKQLWKGVSEHYLPKPKSYPSAEVIRHPIWSTWATFHGDINQNKVMDYAHSIKNAKFQISQLEIDDNWTPHYGQYTFNPSRFGGAKQMIANLTQMGIATTVWVHWFFNDDSDNFKEAHAAGYLIQELDKNDPLIVSWWEGSHAGILDFTNPDAVKWYLKKLSDLKTNFGVTSFKFDAGEVKFVRDKKYKTKNQLGNPNHLTTKYAETAAQSDTVEHRQEMRVAFRSQASSNLVRMFDRNSAWGHDMALKTLIPTALVFGFMGYPYVLPDLIGGNAYGAGPDPELYVRWLQVNTFLPFLQFSVPPWSFKNDTISQITHKFVDLHEKYADKIINLAKNAQQTGEPIVRPLWWIAPTDKEALQLDNEFLLGDDLLVAPIQDKGATARDVYLPAGKWHDELRGVTHNGGAWLRGYKAALDELPYFTKTG